MFGRIKKKVFKCDRNHIHKVYVTQIHHDTLFFDPIFAKNIQILAENIHFSFVKIPHFWLFSGVLEVKLKLQDKFYAIFDHNKCPSSEKEDEKCNLRISYFHQIQPIHDLHPSSICLLTKSRITLLFSFWEHLHRPLLLLANKILHC